MHGQWSNDCCEETNGLVPPARANIEKINCDDVCDRNPRGLLARNAHCEQESKPHITYPDIS